MVDNLDSHSIEFIGEKKKKPTKYQESINELFDLNTQESFITIISNYNKFVSNMLSTCSNICIKELNYPTLSINEEMCVNICQKKFFSAYAIGENYLKSVASKTKGTDIFSDVTHLELIDTLSKI